MPRRDGAVVSSKSLVTKTTAICRMGPIEQSLYDRIHQRYPADGLVSFLRNSQDLQIRMDDFIGELNIAESRNPFYTKTVVKALIHNLALFDEEDIGSGIKVVPAGDVWLSEWLYEKYVELVNVNQPDPMTKDVIQYPIAEDVKVKIEETPYLISASGTTGFRTWEAALYLSHYLTTKTPQLIGDQCRVLELGAGTGLVSAALCLKYADKLAHVYVTDGDSQLTPQLDRNFRLNAIDTSAVTFRRLWWNEDQVPHDIDYVFAADVTYDSSVIPDLCQCIRQCLSQVPCKSCFVSATVRNEHTTNAFESCLRDLGLDCRVVSTVFPAAHAQAKIEPGLANLLCKPLLAAIRIYQIQSFD